MLDDTITDDAIDHMPSQARDDVHAGVLDVVPRPAATDPGQAQTSDDALPSTHAGPRATIESNHRPNEFNIGGEEPEDTAA